MIRLILDTATDHYYLSMLNNDEIIEEAYEYGQGNHSETLMPRLEKMLKDNHLVLKDIDEVYTGIGPGSYTGERIAVVIAKMIAAMNPVKVYEFSTLALIASSKDEESFPFIDARRGTAYVSHFSKDLERLDEDQVVVVDEYFEGKDKSLIIQEGKPNPIKLIHSKEVRLVEDPDGITPNYIQLVEAERKRRGLK